MNSIAKALIAGIGAFGTGLITAASDGGVVGNEWYVIAGGTLVTFAATWAKSNGS